jgi:hypothetical protein
MLISVSVLQGLWLGAIVWDGIRGDVNYAIVHVICLGANCITLYYCRRLAIAAIWVSAQKTLLDEIQGTQGRPR